MKYFLSLFQKVSDGNILFLLSQCIYNDTQNENDYKSVHKWSKMCKIIVHQSSVETTGVIFQWEKIIVADCEC